MMSFRVDDEEAAIVNDLARTLGIDKSELLRDALHRHVVRLQAEKEIAIWTAHPLSAGEISLSDIADWGPAEDWSDWADAAR